MGTVARQILTTQSQRTDCPFTSLLGLILTSWRPSSPFHRTHPFRWTTPTFSLS